MNDRELADKCVALGVADTQGAFGMKWYRLNNRTMSMGLQPIHFVRDWRVAGALMEAKCWGVNTVHKGDEWEAHVVPIGQIKEYTARNESAPRAIIEAGCEALL